MSKSIQVSTRYPYPPLNQGGFKTSFERRFYKMKMTATIQYYNDKISKSIVDILVCKSMTRRVGGFFPYILYIYFLYFYYRKYIYKVSTSIP